MFGHVGLLHLGIPLMEHKGDSAASVLFDALKTVLGDEGTFLTPSFTYSYCQSEIYDLQKSLSTVGAFSEYLRKQDGCRRSIDPIFSLVGFGPQIDAVFNDLPKSCFGKNCVYDRLYHLNANIFNIGVSLRYLTPIHYLEKKLDVPYRYDKTFEGVSILDGMTRIRQAWVYYVRTMDEGSKPNCEVLEAAALANGLCAKAQAGLGVISLANMQDYFAFAEEKCQQDPYFLVKGSNFIS
ncbi:AAC(3) family N-acetyltransferase [Pseudomonadota bacterium]